MLVATDERRGVCDESSDALNIRGIGNAVVVRILGSPLHRLLSGAVAIVDYKGRRSGRRVRLPVQYATLDGQVIVCPARSESKLWWRNFEDPHPATITIAGRRVDTVGAVVKRPDPKDRFAVAYRQRFPKGPALKLIVVFTAGSQ